MRFLPLLFVTLLLFGTARADDADDLRERAESLIEQGLPAEAIPPLREAARLLPDDVDLQRHYMELMKDQGYGRDVVAERKQRVQEHPEDALAHYLYGVASGDPTTARDEFERALVLDPKQKYAQQGLGSVAVAEGKFDEAIVDYQAALALDPGFAEVHNKLANLYAARGEQDKAKAAWRRAMEAAPDDYHAWMNMGAVLSMEGDLKGAVDLLAGAVERAPGHARAHFNYAYVLFKLDRYDEAMAHFAAALAINPRDRTVRGTQALAQAVHSGDVPRSAIEPYEQAVASMLTDPATAAQNYKEVLLLAPDFAFAHMNLGVALAALGQVQEAEEAMTKATELAPDDPDPWRNLGMFYLMTRRPPDAVAALLRASALDPEDPQLLSALATSQAGNGQGSASTATYRRAVALRPRDPELRVEMAAAQAAAGDLSGAEATSRVALEIAPDLVPARVQLVAILREQRRFDDALKELDELERQIPGHPDVARERAALRARRDALRDDAAAGKVRLSRILLSDEAAAKDLSRRARGGEDFAALARRGSGDEAARGGDIGYVDPEELQPAIAEAVRGLMRGQVSEPVSVGALWLVLKRTD